MLVLPELVNSRLCWEVTEQTQPNNKNYLICRVKLQDGGAGPEPSACLVKVVICNSYSGSAQRSMYFCTHLQQQLQQILLLNITSYIQLYPIRGSIFSAPGLVYCYSILVCTLRIKPQPMLLHSRQRDCHLGFSCLSSK